MSKKLLVVDDDKINARVVQLQGRSRGFEILMAYNGEEGLEMMKEHKPDLILLDIEMPEMNGYTFLLKMREMEGFNQIPVIVQTVHEGMQPIFKFNLVKDYVMKPLKFDELFAKISQLIGPQEASPKPENPFLNSEDSSHKPPAPESKSQD